MRVQTSHPTEIPLRTAPESLAIPATLALTFDAATKARGLNGGIVLRECMMAWLRVHSGSQAMARDRTRRARNVRLSRHASTMLDRAAYRHGVEVGTIIEELLTAKEVTP